MLSTQKFVNQNSFDERFPSYNPRLAKQSYILTSFSIGKLNDQS